MTTTQTLTAKAAEQTTEVLMGALLIMDKATALTEAERLTRATISDVIETRHNLTAAMDAIYADDDFTGTYTEALMVALAATIEVAA